MRPRRGTGCCDAWQEPGPCTASRISAQAGALQNSAQQQNLFYQYVRCLEAQGETVHETVFIEGTKLESRAGRYPFVWRKRVEKQLARIKAKVYAALSVTSLEALEQRLTEMEAGIAFVHGSGRRKSEAQKEWEALDVLRRRWREDEEKLAIMGDGRNSYSKTDPDAAGAAESIA